MSVNKIVYGSKTLIDLSNDTLTPDMLFAGLTGHDKAGNEITGTLFEGYPDEQCFFNVLRDADGDEILDSSGDSIYGKTVYRKA